MGRLVLDLEEGHGVTAGRRVPLDGEKWVEGGDAGDRLCGGKTASLGQGRSVWPEWPCFLRWDSGPRLSSFGLPGCEVSRGHSLERHFLGLCWDLLHVSRFDALEMTSRVLLHLFQGQRL